MKSVMLCGALMASTVSGAGPNIKKYDCQSISSGTKVLMVIEDSRLKRATALEVDVKDFPAAVVWAKDVITETYSMLDGQNRQLWMRSLPEQTDVRISLDVDSDGKIADSPIGVIVEYFYRGQLEAVEPFYCQDHVPVRRWYQ